MELKSIRSFLFLLSGEEGDQGDALDCDDLESDTRNISLGLSLLTEASHEDLVVLGHVVEATVPRYEGSNFLAVFLEHDSDSLSDGGVGLFGLHTDFLDDESLGHAAAHEGVFESGAEESSVVFFIIPLLESALGGQLSTSSNTSWFA